MRDIWDVIIIGGGLAGYIASNYLAREGLSVLILEKGNSVGGRAVTTKNNGHFFNLGPHALYKKGKAKAILEDLGIQLNGRTPKLGGILTEGHMEYAAPFSPIGTITTRYINWNEKLEWGSVLLKLMRVDTQQVAGTTFLEWVTQTARFKKVQSLLLMLGRLATYCHAPERVSAAVILGHLKNVLGGVLYLDRGWQTIVDQLHNQAVIRGVLIQTRKTVKQIAPNQEDYSKVTLSDGEEILCRNVICTAGPSELAGMLGRGEGDVLSSMIPVRGATLDVSLTHLPRPKQLFAMDLTNPIYYSVHSAYAKLSEDRNSTVLHVFKYHHPDEQIDGARVKNELEQFLDKIQPCWRDQVITSRYLPQITVNKRLPQVGDEYKLRSSNIGIRGLYIAGDWACPDFILADGAAASAKRAAEEIIRERTRCSHANQQ
ncbi:FAD-dependent pyridine nucleotide-disulfide oxidoreductase [Bacillus sp. FJAT-27225]|uniref:phytoene desaturase family protein n=1 Tax=Bacillus sp. FJAT-27225 TaxID=1743144 RepID=UPI00080C2B8E|nr:FAD-dependent oxidoreductase [Bacillus sp. FJAT-27225]OCA83101.1 FAD-dependent pyridine nucleotide-disulfide oxidoreductase [Bacillus sp. FJAT-27225]